jgi:glucan phosphoethanolaminetransferase (alkaline phosphatase superfamily)
MSEQRDPLHPLFRLAALSAAIFIFTIFAMVATVFSDEESPMSRFLNAHAGTLIAVEAAATVLLAILAMTADRRRTLRQMMDNEGIQTQITPPLEAELLNHEGTKDTKT